MLISFVWYIAVDNFSKYTTNQLLAKFAELLEIICLTRSISHPSREKKKEREKTLSIGATTFFKQCSSAAHTLFEDQFAGISVHQHTYIQQQHVEAQHPLEHSIFISKSLKIKEGGTCITCKRTCIIRIISNKLQKSYIKLL